MNMQWCEILFLVKMEVTHINNTIFVMIYEYYD